MKKFLPLLALATVLLSALWPSAREADAWFRAFPFAETGFAIRNDKFYDYFRKRGGLRTFGYPVSREFTLLGSRVQFFQRLIMELLPDGSVTTMNILDPGLMPYTRINNATFPAHDEALVATAPAPGSEDYHSQVLEFVEENAPNTWEGKNVNFHSTFLRTVSLADAYPQGGGNPAWIPGLDLEMWGVPTSKPLVDPNNHDFIYLRFQRGIMHFDQRTRATQGLLLADYFKAIITGVGLPKDLEEQAKGSRFSRQYDNTRPLGLSRPSELPNTDMKGAFEKEDTKLTALVVQQEYQRGWMLWRSDTRDILVLYSKAGGTKGSGRWEAYPDTWTEGQPEAGGETPPEGLVEPVRGFGKLWRSSLPLRDALGWAVGPEVPFPAAEIESLPSYAVIRTDPIFNFWTDSFTMPRPPQRTVPPPQQ